MADSVRWKRVSDAQWNAESIVDGKILFNYDKKFISLDQGTTRVKYYSFEEDNIANTYSSSSTYAVGDYVRYLDTLYRCNTAITVGEAFTASKWTSVIVMNEMSSLNTNLAYSYSETICGTWVDGKPLYRKVINIGNLPNSTGKSVAHGITGLGNAQIISGRATNGTIMLPLPYAQATAPISLNVNGANIDITTTSDRSAYSGIAIIEYTKS